MDTVVESIRDEAGMQRAFKRLEHIFQAEPGTPEANEVEALVTLIEAYESQDPSISEFFLA